MAEDLISVEKEIMNRIVTLKPGLYLINEITKGTQVTYLVDKIADVPEAMRVAELEKHRLRISKAISKKIDKLRDKPFILFSDVPSVKELVDCVFNTVRTYNRKTEYGED